MIENYIEEECNKPVLPVKGAEPFYPDEFRVRRVNNVFQLKLSLMHFWKVISNIGVPYSTSNVLTSVANTIKAIYARKLSVRFWPQLAKPWSTLVEGDEQFWPEWQFNLRIV